MKKIILAFNALLSSTIGYSQFTVTCDTASIFATTGANAVCLDTSNHVTAIFANGYANHDREEGLQPPAFSMEPYEVEHYFCLNPTPSSTITPLYEEVETTAGCTDTYAFGVGVNGVKFDPNTAVVWEYTSGMTTVSNLDWHYEAAYQTDFSIGYDGGHLNPFDEYHYHTTPSHYYINDLGVDGTAHSPLVGIAADGFPVYYKYVYADRYDNTSAIVGLSSGYSLREGDRGGDGTTAPNGTYDGQFVEDYEYKLTDLDECNGRYGVTPEYPNGTYYYVLTDEFPWIPRCFKGEYLDPTFRVGPSASCGSSTAISDCGANEPIYGCMDPFSVNYNPSADTDDGSCYYTYWNGTSWSEGAPDTTVSVAVIGNEYATATDGNIITGDLIVLDTVVAGEGGYINVNGDLGNNSKIRFLTGASLVTKGAVYGEDFVFRKNTTFSDVTGKYSVIGSPVQEATTDQLGSLVYDYDETVAYGSDGSTRFAEVPSPVAMVPGNAYFSAYTGTVIFTGRPNAGDLSVDLVYNTSDDGVPNAGFNLVSNPYPSAINYDAFIGSNADITGAIYLWDDEGSDDVGHTNSNADYLIANSIGAVSGTNASWDGNIRSMQGFFVKATSAGTLYFADTMRVSGNNDAGGFFRKQTQPSNNIMLSLAGAGSSSNALIGFREDATFGEDRLYDAVKFKGNSPVQLYSYINDSEYAIQGLPVIESTVVVELGFDISEAGNYKLSLETETYASKVYLLDNVLSTKVEISNGGTYQFESESGMNNRRFSLILQEGLIGGLNNTFSPDVKVYTSAESMRFEMSNGQNIDYLTIVDLRGKVLYEKSVTDTTITLFRNQLNRRFAIATVYAGGAKYTMKLH